MSAPITVSSSSQSVLTSPSRVSHDIARRHVDDVTGVAVERRAPCSTSRRSPRGLNEESSESGGDEVSDRPGAVEAPARDHGLVVSETDQFGAVPSGQGGRCCRSGRRGPGSRTHCRGRALGEPSLRVGAVERPLLLDPRRGWRTSPPRRRRRCRRALGRTARALARCRDRRGDATAAGGEQRPVVERTDRRKCVLRQCDRSAQFERHRRRTPAASRSLRRSSSSSPASATGGRSLGGSMLPFGRLQPQFRHRVPAR